MSLYLADSTDLTAVADAIRLKSGDDQGLAFPDGFIEAIGDIGGEGGGQSYSSGTLTPAENTLDATFNIGSSSYTNFLIWATADPYSGTRTGCLTFRDFTNNIAMVIASNNAGTSPTGARDFTAASDAMGFSKSGSTVTYHLLAGANGTMSYLMAGITYKWIAW